MMKQLLLIVLMGIVCYGQNWMGYKQRDTIAEFSADSIKFSKWFDLSQGENSIGYIEADDTTNTGSDGDSLKFAVLYQVATISRHSSTNRVYDTVPSNFVLQDTFSLDSIFIPNDPTVAAVFTTDAATGVITTYAGLVDTTTLAAYDLTRQEYLWTPPWRLLIRFCLVGVTGNKVGEHVTVFCGIDQRKGLKTLE